jgi:lipoyl(octanoyl) transferase
MLNIQHLGLEKYENTWDRMKQFTMTRDKNTIDEIWLLEHFPVYTQGQAGKAEHILNAGNIPIIQSDRGGQVTYHAPGQLIAYVLMDIERRKKGVRTLVCDLERLIMALLSHHGIAAHIREGAPGVYVEDKKIASIGLRVKNGCSYHGLALNVSMDLAPFSGINPCGFHKMQMTHMYAFVPEISIEMVIQGLTREFLTMFGS